MFFDANINLYEVHKRRYHLDIDEDSDEISMIGYAALSSAIALRLAFMGGSWTVLSNNTTIIRAGSLLDS